MNGRIVLVCVTAQQSSKQLVMAGKQLAEKWGAALEVVSVILPEKQASGADASVIEEIHSLTRQAGGEMMIYFSTEPVYTLTAHIGKRKPLTVVTGYPGENSNNFIDTLRALLPDQEISMVNGEQIYSILPRPEAAG